MAACSFGASLAPICRRFHAIQSPRGIRNFNPGNIRHAKGTRWQGMSANQNDSAFVQFTGPQWGIRAIARTLITYQDKHALRTIRQIISRWAPPSENNTESYIRQVAARVGVAPTRVSTCTTTAPCAPWLRPSSGTRTVPARFRKGSGTARD